MQTFEFVFENCLLNYFVICIFCRCVAQVIVSASVVKFFAQVHISYLFC